MCNGSTATEVNVAFATAGCGKKNKKMGGDGGNVPKRADLVKTKGYRFARGDHQGGMGSKPNMKIRAIQAKDLIEHVSKYELCALTQLPLEHPVVCSAQGDFFIKEKILEALLNKTLPATFGVKSIKQLFNVNKNFRGVCQVSGAALGDTALLVRPCGCVLSEKSEMQTNSDCPACGSFADEVLAVKRSLVSLPVVSETQKTKEPASKKPRLEASIADLFH